MTPTASPDAPPAGSRSRATAWSVRLSRVPLSLHHLLFRLGIASIFLKAGLIKQSSWDMTVNLFRDEYRVPLLPPEIAAILATMFELGCSMLLVIGLATRLATVPLLGMIATIQLFVYPNAWPEHLVWASILLFLLTRGAGSISVDRLIADARGRRR